MFRGKPILFLHLGRIKGLHQWNKCPPVTIRHIPLWESIGQVKLDWSEKKERVGMQRGKDGTTESRRLEGKGRKMKDPRSRWGASVQPWIDMSTNPRLCWQVGPVNSTVWLCQESPFVHSVPAVPGFSCGHTGQRVCPVFHFKQGTMLTGQGPGEMLLFGHDSWALRDFQNLPNRRQ